MGIPVSKMFPAPPKRGDVQEMSKEFFSRFDLWMDYVTGEVFEYKCEYCKSLFHKSKTNCCPNCGGPNETV